MPTRAGAPAAAAAAAAARRLRRPPPPAAAAETPASADAHSAVTAAPTQPATNGASSAPPAAASDADAVATLFRWPAQIPAEAVSVAGDFSSWQPIPLARMPSGDWARTLSLPPGPAAFKFLVDGRYEASPAERIAVDAGGADNNARLVAANAELRWPRRALGGAAVLAAGDWSGWGELLPLREAPDGSGDLHLPVCLPPGTYHCSFLVDGEWRLRPDVDAAHAPDGRFANVLRAAPAPAFRIFYATGWPDAALRVRPLDAAGAPAGAWRVVPLAATPSRGAPGGGRWVAAAVDAAPAPGAPAPAALELVPFSAAAGGEDRPAGGGAYLAPHPGGYRLAAGAMRPFARAAAPPAMLVADLDGTLVGEGPAAAAALAEFRDYWEGSAALAGCALAYNTGRSLGQFRGLLEGLGGLLPVPDALVTAVGTKVFLLDREGGTRGTASGGAWREDAGWARALDEGWDLAAARAAAQAAVDAAPADVHWLDDGSEHPHRVALAAKAAAAPGVAAGLEAAAAAAGLRFQTIISGVGEYRYVDCVAARAGKRAALEYVAALFGVPAERTLAAGDSGNDALMLGGTCAGVLVGNAQPELVAWALARADAQGAPPRLVLADAPLGRGVLEGLMRHGLY